ncbi:VOC family protein [Halobacillus sp. A5]|uniref:VOC family protein n=1 Tax=Halobacillus sp. A5 TaxID=2880263 RepID=UPI0020A67517|nr:VOC family protein [Halobacillus sp. A5]MCP3029333.1 VOC family protein [Halobacillus sp. A5]
MIHPIHPQINTVFVHVTDLEHSVEWYGQLLGIKTDTSFIEKPVYTFSLANHTSLTLGAGPAGNEPKSFQPIPCPLFNIHTNDIHKSYSFVEDREIQIAQSITEYEDFSFFNIYDPDGHIVMICSG